MGSSTGLDLRVHLGFDEIRGEWLLHEFTKGQHLGDPRPAFVLSLAVVLAALFVGGSRRALSDLVGAELVAGFWALVGAQVLAAHASS